jgi:hypothetical protein
MDPDQGDDLEMTPAHPGQEALQGALDKKAGNLSALVPHGARAFLRGARPGAGPGAMMS